MNILRAVIDKIVQHAREESPIEACGYLAEKDGVLVEALRLTNVDASPEHFSFAPAEQFAVLRQTRSMGLRIHGVYHSHPTTPARPSAEDIRLANDPALLYVIASLAQEEADVKAFSIRDGKVTAEPLTIEES